MTLSPVPRRAVILAAGLGTRLRPFTDERPKPLVEVHGVPILHNALRNLAAVGVEHTTIVVGYRKEVIQRSYGVDFEGMRISYAESSVFDRTGSAYSMWLAREALLEGDAFLLEGDVFFDVETLKRLLSRNGDVAALDVFDETMTGSAVVLSSHGAVTEFRMHQTAADLGREPLYKTINIYRFTAATLRNAIVPRLDAWIDNGGTKTYIEQFLATLVADRSIDLQTSVCSDVRWFEIDSEADLRTAERIFDLLRVPVPSAM